MTNLETLSTFYALSGCDNCLTLMDTSRRLHGNYSSKTHLLQGLEKAALIEQTIRDAKRFVCRMYGVSETDSCDDIRVIIFCKLKSSEVLPPTTDAESSFISIKLIINPWYGDN